MIRSKRWPVIGCAGMLVATTLAAVGVKVAAARPDPTEDPVGHHSDPVTGRRGRPQMAELSRSASGERAPAARIQPPQALSPGRLSQRPRLRLQLVRPIWTDQAARPSQGHRGHARRRATAGSRTGGTTVTAAAPPGRATSLQTVIPTILAAYPILPQRRYHALIGISMGGLGATYLGGRLPGFFGSVASLSGFVDPQWNATVVQPAMAVFSDASVEGRQRPRSYLWPPGRLLRHRSQPDHSRGEPRAHPGVREHRHGGPEQGRP